MGIWNERAWNMNRNRVISQSYVQLYGARDRFFFLDFGSGVQEILFIQKL